MGLTARDKHLVIVSLVVLQGGSEELESSEVLLLKRRGSGMMDGYWSPPVGHLEAGEALVAASCRECREETGLCVPEALVKPLLLMRFDGGLHLAFQARLWGADAVPWVAEPRLSSEVRWHKLNHLPNPVVPWFEPLLDRLRMSELSPHWLQDDSFD